MNEPSRELLAREPSEQRHPSSVERRQQIEARLNRARLAIRKLRPPLLVVRLDERLLLGERPLERLSGPVSAGLRSMYPSGEYLRRLYERPVHGTEYYALGADDKPTGASLLARFGWKVVDAAVDGVFGRPTMW